MSYLLQVTEANHDENAFYTLGGAGWGSAEERDEEFAAIPAYTHDCDNDNKCYLVDVIEPNGDLLDSKEISVGQAHVLLGITDFEPAREEERKMWDVIRGVV